MTRCDSLQRNVSTLPTSLSEEQLHTNRTVTSVKGYPTVLLVCILRMLCILPAGGEDPLSLEVRSTTRTRCSAQPKGLGLAADLTNKPP